MNNSIVFLFFSFFLLSFISCNTVKSSNQKVNSVDFGDGIYLIERKTNDIKETRTLSANERVIEFNKEFIEKTDQDVTYIVINVNEFAPLELKVAPRTENGYEDRKRLLLTLADTAKEELKSFTSDHLNKLTTIVVNGEALTTHKIKSVIDNGKLQITRCTDNACELLYVELQDNIVGE